MELGERYLLARGRVRSLVADLDEPTWDEPVPGCPGWTVHDLIAHVVGLTADALDGNMAGAPGPAWTAAQVDKRRGTPGNELLAEWDANADRFAEAVTNRGLAPPVLDLLTHEQDLRGALGEPGGDPDDLSWSVDLLIGRLGDRLTEAGVPALSVRTEHGEQQAGTGVPGASVRTTDLELFRLAFGRRSRDQILGLEWSGDPEPYLAHLSVFELHPVALVE